VEFEQVDLLGAVAGGQDLRVGRDEGLEVFDTHFVLTTISRHAE